MQVESGLHIYSMSICLRITIQGHSLSNSGSHGSNRMMGRTLLLADGTLTDALSGNIFKHYHSLLLTERFREADAPLCSACTSLDGRRAAALDKTSAKDELSIHSILMGCGICDSHGFLVTAKKATEDGTQESRSRISKSSVYQFSFLLAVPERSRESMQIYQRSGNADPSAQMLFEMPARSGEYALCVRYNPFLIGVNTDNYEIVVTDQAERTLRYREGLLALRDQLTSLCGALMATQLPHQTALVGAIVVLTGPGRAPLHSALDDDFIERLAGMIDGTRRIYRFENDAEFFGLMNQLAQLTEPYMLSPKPPADQNRKARKVPARRKKTRRR